MGCMTQLPSSVLPPGNPDILVLLEQKMFDLSEACSQVIMAIHQIAQDRQFPILIALDGGSGAGKSTLASMLEQQLDCVVVQLDDFFAASVPDWEWDSRSVSERASGVSDWQKVRTEALEPLLAGQTARWHP